jgi:excinuclease UvrABC ATPase subunit
MNVGLDYLALKPEVQNHSGGEAQRYSFSDTTTLN